MTEHKEPAKKAAPRKRAETKHDEQSEQVDRRVGDEVTVTEHSGGMEHSVNPPLKQVEEYQSIGDDPGFLAAQTVEPDFEQAEHERQLAAGREYLDGRTRNLP